MKNAKDLKQIEKLINEGNSATATQMIESFEQRNNLSNSERFSCQLLKSNLYSKTGKLEEALKIVEQVITESIEIKTYEKTIDAHIRKSEILWRLGKIDQSLEMVSKGEEIFQKLIQEQKLGKKRRFGFLRRYREEKEKADQISLRRAMLMNQKGNIFIRKGQFDPALELFKECLSIREKIKDKKGIAESRNSIGIIYAIKGELDQALEHFQLCEQLFEELDNKQYLARTLNNIGNIYTSKGNLDQALNYYQQSLNFNQEFGDNMLIASTLNNIGNIYMSKGELNKALTYCEQSLNLKKEIGNEQSIAETVNNIGMIYMEKGEIERALENFKACLKLSQEVGNTRGIARSMNNAGMIYMQKGDLEKAWSSLDESLNLKKTIGNNIETSYTLLYLVLLSIDRNDHEQARIYLEELQKINEIEDNKAVRQRSCVAEALVLKASTRARNWSKATDLLEQVVKEEIVNHELTTLALLNLCELLLAELRMSNDPEVLKDVKNLVNRLLELAKNQNSYSLLAEAYLLQAKLALIELDVQNARNLLTQAQLLATEKDLQRIALKISNEHDTLLDQLGKWEELVERNAPISERADLAHVEDLVGKMIRKTAEEYPEIPEEEPVLLMIMDESGLSLFSKDFLPGSTIDEQLVGGFLTAIQAFSGEIFSQSIDRVKLEEYTLLMKAESPFLICYVIKGQSFGAQQKLIAFAQKIKENSLIWGLLGSVIETGEILSQSNQDAIEKLIVTTF